MLTHNNEVSPVLVLVRNFSGLYSCGTGTGDSPQKNGKLEHSVLLDCTNDLISRRGVERMNKTRETR